MEAECCDATAESSIFSYAKSVQPIWWPPFHCRRIAGAHHRPILSGGATTGRRLEASLARIGRFRMLLLRPRQFSRAVLFACCQTTLVATYFASATTACNLHPRLSNGLTVSATVALGRRKGVSCSRTFHHPANIDTFAPFSWSKCCILIPSGIVTSSTLAHLFKLVSINIRLSSSSSSSSIASLHGIR